MFNIFAVRHNIKAIHAYTKLAYVVSGIRACYKYDPRIHEAFHDLQDGSELILTMHPSIYSIYAIKTQKGLKCSLRKDAYISNGALVTFKSFQAALPILNNKISFTDAFNQNRYIIQGDIGLGMHLVNVLDMAQATLATAAQRRRFLKEKPFSSNVEFKVKMTAWFNGWR